jgi:hypothetical protein
VGAGRCGSSPHLTALLTAVYMDTNDGLSPSSGELADLARSRQEGAPRR